jgi:hypothetical protein
MGTGSFIAAQGCWVLTVALPNDLPETRARAVQLFDAFAEQLERMTWGRMRLGEVALVVRPHGLAAADILISPGAGADAVPGSIGRPGAFIQWDWSPPTGDSPSPVAKLMHEFGHYAFGLGDEYREVRGADGKRVEVADCQCIMARLTCLQFCSTDHVPGTANGQNLAHRDASCRTVMARRYPVLGLRAKAVPPSVAGAVTYIDVQPSSITVLTSCQGASPETARAVDAIVPVWTAASQVTGGQFNVLPPRFVDPLRAVSAGLALIDPDRRHLSQALLLVGFPSSKATAAARVKAVARRKGIPVHVVSPSEPDAPLRDFALATGGACEVVVREGVEAEVDLRLRLLGRLAHAADGFGIGLLHRVVATPTDSVSQVLNVESTADSVLIAVCLPSRAAVEVRIVDPAGHSVATQASSDGSVVWASVASPPAGGYTVSARAVGGAVPIGLIGLIHNPRVRVEPARQLGAYRAGQSIDLNTTLLGPAALAPVVQPVAVPLTQPPAQTSATPAAWGDGGVAVDSQSQGAELLTTASWRGYADCRIDYRLNLVDGESVVRVVPFQLRVIDRRTRRTTGRQAEQGEG